MLTASNTYYHLFMIFAVFDVLLAVNMCINYSFFFTFIFAVLLQQKILKFKK